jgi:D-lyxose ketol-isomerase
MDKDLIRIQTEELLSKARLTLSQKEIGLMEIADFGLSNGRVEGAQIITLFNTSRVAGKVIVLLPGQTLPEHRHVDQGNHMAKEEILRIVQGTLYLYVTGSGNDSSRIPYGKENVYSARTLIELNVNGQYIIQPGTAHWLTAGTEGCVLYSFSSAVMDKSDVFTDPLIIR